MIRSLNKHYNNIIKNITFDLISFYTKGFQPQGVWIIFLSWTFNRLAIEGPHISKSTIPTLNNCFAKLKAKLVATVDLPTPITIF